MKKIDVLKREIQEYGLDLYILLKYGTLVFFAFGGTVEQYNECMNDYVKSFSCQVVNYGIV